MPSDNIDRNLADLAEVAVATLATEMRTARNSKDRQAAANSILDRIGFGRSTRVQSDVADGEIRNALEAASSTAASLARSTPQTQDAPDEKSVRTLEIHEAEADDGS